MTYNWKEVGERLRYIRKYWGFTQKDVAEYLGVTQAQITRLEKGHRRLNKHEQIDKLCLLFRIEEEWLLTGKEMEMPKKMHLCMNLI